MYKSSKSTSILHQSCIPRKLAESSLPLRFAFLCWRITLKLNLMDTDRLQLKHTPDHFKQKGLNKRTKTKRTKLLTRNLSLHSAWLILYLGLLFLGSDLAGESTKGCLCSSYTMSQKGRLHESKHDVCLSCTLLIWAISWQWATT